MIEISKKFEGLVSWLKAHPGEPIPMQHMRPLLECLAEAAVIIRHYGRDANWFPIKQTGKFSFMTMTEGDATKRAKLFLEKYGWS